MGSDKYVYFTLEGERAARRDLEELAADAGAADLPAGAGSQPGDPAVRRVAGPGGRAGCGSGSTPRRSTCSTRRPASTSPEPLTTRRIKGLVPGGAAKPGTNPLITARAALDHRAGRLDHRAERGRGRSAASRSREDGAGRRGLSTDSGWNCTPAKPRPAQRVHRAVGRVAGQLDRPVRRSRAKSTSDDRGEAWSRSRPARVVPNRSTSRWQPLVRRVAAGAAAAPAAPASTWWPRHTAEQRPAGRAAAGRPAPRSVGHLRVGRRRPGRPGPGRPPPGRRRRAARPSPCTGATRDRQPERAQLVGEHRR